MKVGIIGCGSIARQRHAREYRLNPNVEIMGFYDLQPLRAEAMVKDFGGQVYNTVEEMLQDASIDAVSVCAANKDHARLSIAALDSGKHVLCEKPMAVTLAACEDMVAAAHRNGKRLLIGQNQRLSPAHVRAKQLLSEDALGRVISFQSTFGHKGPESWSIDASANTWFFKKSEASFGSMADLGIHKIDLVRYLIGGKVVSVFATLDTLDKKFPDGRPIEVDDNSIELLHFDNGAMGTVTTSWTFYGEECNATMLYCEKGIMKMYQNPEYPLEVIYADGTKVHYELGKMQTNDDAQQTSSGVIDVFVEAVMNGGTTLLDAEDVLESMRVVFACLESSEKKAPVTL